MNCPKIVSYQVPVGRTVQNIKNVTQIYCTLILYSIEISFSRDIQKRSICVEGDVYGKRKIIP